MTAIYVIFLSSICHLCHPSAIYLPSTPHHDRLQDSTVNSDCGPCGPSVCQGQATPPKSPSAQDFLGGPPHNGL
eukprot:1153692-Pelagomonas_calceolata.AAC.2